MGFITLTEPLSRKSLWIGVFSEIIGTFLLVAAGCGIIFINFSHAEQNVIPNSLRLISAGAGFGIVVGCIVFALGFSFPHTTAHINPAFTIACIVLNKFSVIRGGLYIIGQFIGAIAGAALLYGCIDEMRDIYFPCTMLNNTGPWQGFALEVFGTFTLMSGALCIITVMERHNYGPLVITGGLTTVVAILVIILGPYTGAGLNPARSFGPALIFGGKCWPNHWVYIFGPLTGGFFAGCVVRIMQFNETETKDEPVRKKEIKEAEKLVAGSNNA